ncbi:MAG: methyl-accepting chemotaxis protein [Verrucomicrobiales bacterium]|jgi:methyl-accepting chemotaxis protein
MTDAGQPASSSSSGGLRRRLIRSHAVIAAIGVGMLLVSLLVIAGLRTSVRRLAKLRAPTAEASTLALAGVAQSLADLRGWVALGSPEFKTQRAEAWEQDVEPAIARLEELSPDWTNPDNVQRLAEARAHLRRLKQAQWWIEDVARTPGNQPARVQMSQDAGPIAEEISSAIDAMIAMERNRPAGSGSESGSARRLAALADFRAAFAQLHALLSRFADTGLESDYEAFVIELTYVPKLLGRARQLDPEQAALAKLISEQLLAFETVSRDVAAARRSPSWNVALYRMRTEAIPAADEATRVLSEMSDDQRALMAADARQVTAISNAALAGAVSLILLMLFVTRLVSRRSAARLSAPIAALSRATEEFASGVLDHDLPVTSDDELGQLTASFNTMRAARARAKKEIKERTTELERSNRELGQFAYVASHDLKGTAPGRFELLRPAGAPLRRPVR